MSHLSARLVAASVAVGALAVLAGCAGPATPAANPTSAATADAAFPVTVENCGTSVTIEHRPERIVMVNNDALSNLEALDAVDRIVAVTATPQAGLYEQSTYDTLAPLSVLSTQKNATGGSVVSQESILGAQPDLVIAPEKAVDRAALAAVGIPVYSPTAYCADPPAAYTQTATFQRVWDEVTTYGQILGVPDLASTVIASAKEAVANSGSVDRGTAAALYVSSGGAVLSPYGGPSMVTPVFAAAGLSNVYADTSQRVFDANVEDVIARDPATIVLLSSEADPQTTRNAFLSSPDVAGLSAVKNNRVVVLPFPYTDPPSILSTRGPGVLADELAALR